jgi:hypothetical protein
MMILFDVIYVVVLTGQIAILSAFAAALAKPSEARVAVCLPLSPWLRWPAVVTSIMVAIGAMISIADILHAGAHVRPGVLTRSAFGLALIAVLILSHRDWLWPELEDNSQLIRGIKRFRP